MVTFVQLSVIGFAVAGEQACAALGITLPDSVWALLRANKVLVLMGTWLAGNMLVSALTSTGAFEVSYGSDVLFSKLDTGRMPTLQELKTLLSAAVEAAQ